MVTIAKAVEGCGDEALRTVLSAAISKLFAEDTALFTRDVAERAIAHRLAIHLSLLVPEWHVDCEYNRDGHKPKRLKVRGRRKDVHPDLVVHRRGTQDNLLVLELKKTTGDKDSSYDLEKLDAFVEELGYRHALFLRFLVKTDTPGITEAIWIASEKHT